MKDNQNENTKLNILDAAMHHFAKFGYKGASIAKIAAQAKVSKSLIFWYFQSKNNLFESLVDRFVAQCIATLTKDNPQEKARAKIEKLIDIYWEFVKDHLEFIQIFMNWFLQLDSSEKQKTEPLQKIHSKFEGVFQDYLKEGIEEGIFVENLDVEATALVIVSSLEGILIQLIILKTDPKRIDNSFFLSLKKSIMCGILKRD